jgi:aspartyl-tRNA synthetase
VSGALKPEVCEVLHRTAAEFLAAETAQMFSADAGDSREFIQGPRTAKIDFHALPNTPQSVVGAMRLGEADHIIVK